MSLPLPNYTQAPNVCFDEIFKTLKEGELRVILVLIRQTFGWHKSIERISLGQIADKSGIDRRSVCRSLNSLIAKGLVTKKKFGDKGKERCYFSLLMNAPVEEEKEPDGDISEEELELLSNNSYQCPKVTGGSDLKSPPQGPKVTTPSDLKSPTKETLKETIQKKQQQASPAVSAAASLSKSFEENGQPRISPKLHGVNIPVQDKFEIANKYDEKIIDDAIDWATDPANPPKNCLAASIKFACKNKLTKPVPKADLELVNKAYALKYDEKKVGSTRVSALSKYVEIIQEGCAYGHFCLNYSEKGFLDQFQNALRKNNFQVIPA